MAISNQQIQEWINAGGLDELASEVAASSPYATDTMTGYSLNDAVLDIVDQLRTANNLQAEQNLFLERIAISLEN